MNSALRHHIEPRQLRISIVVPDFISSELSGSNMASLSILQVEDTTLTRIELFRICLGHLAKTCDVNRMQTYTNLRKQYEKNGTRSMYNYKESYFAVEMASSSSHTTGQGTLVKAADN